MSQKPKLPKWLPKPYGTSSLSSTGYPKRSSQIKVETSKVNWWLTSVSWWGHGKCGPAHTICKPMASVKDSTPPWSICLGPYPRKRSQRVEKSHWSMLVHAYNCTQNSATGFSPYFLMFGRQPHLPIDVTLGFALHEQSWNQTPLSLYKNMGVHPVGSEKGWGISGQRSTAT